MARVKAFFPKLGLALLVTGFLPCISSVSLVLKLPQYDVPATRAAAKFLSTPIPWTFGNFTRFPNLGGSAYALQTPAGGAEFTMYREIYRALTFQFFPAITQYLVRGVPAYVARCISNVGQLYRPAYAGFYSDESFAYNYLTYNGEALTIVTSKASIPFDTTKIAGLSTIIAKTAHTLDELIALKRVFAIDMTVYAPYIDPAPDGVLEVPYGLFFLDECVGTTCTNSTRLMPLAIAFPLETPMKIFSPMDSYWSWFLAKGSLNMVVRDAFSAIKGFVSRDMYLSLICTSGKINFSPNHPLACLLQKYCRRVLGLISQCFSVVLSDGGTYDGTRSISGNSTRMRLLPYFTRVLTWNNTLFLNDVADRGIQDVPGYYWRDDLTAINKAINTYVTEYLDLFYKKGDQDILDDSELQGFSNTLQQQIPEFPKILTLQDLVNVFNQILLLPSLFFTSNAAANYQSVTTQGPFPLRYLKPIPVNTVVTEAEVMTYYLLPSLPKGENPIALSLECLLPVNTFGVKGGANVSSASIPKQERRQYERALANVKSGISDFEFLRALVGPNNFGFELFLLAGLAGALYFPQFPTLNSQYYGYCPAALATLGFTRVHRQFLSTLKYIASGIDQRNKKIKKEGLFPVYQVLKPKDVAFHLIS